MRLSDASLITGDGQLGHDAGMLLCALSTSAESDDLRYCARLLSTNSATQVRNWVAEGKKAEGALVLPAYS